MYTIRKILKVIIVLIVLLWVGFFGIIIYAVITDYKPEERMVIPETGSSVPIPVSSDITAMTWNIGYFGLNDSMDFFYDGGTRVVPPKESFEENYRNVTDFLERNDTIDFILLQEVDRKSRRSYKMDEFDAISEKLVKFTSRFAVNYDVFFVPVPLSSPMGKVFSGIATLSKVIPALSVRYAFPGKYGFPKQLFMLDRCFLADRYPLSNGKELVLINTHNEAFDPGNIRKAQMEYLRNFVMDEYNKGNYVVAGGDWNQAPPRFRPEFAYNQVNTKQMELEPGFMPSDWTWSFDSSVPSNRSVTAPYNPSVTITTVIDFFLLSPNVEKISVKCVDLNFRNSDHNPVILSFRLKG